MQARDPRLNELEIVCEAVQKLSRGDRKLGRIEIDDLVVRRVEGDIKEQSFSDDLLADNNQSVFDAVGERVRQLRSKDFEYFYEVDGKRVLIKDNLDTAIKDLNPVQPNESEIQFLRYLRGMLMMAQSSRQIVIGAGNLYERMSERIKDVYDDYMRRREVQGDSPQLTLLMAGEFSNIIKDIYQVKDDKHAGLQLTMARDLASMLEEHPDICTVASMKGSDATTVSKSSLMKISPEYYDRIFGQLPKQAWMQSARVLQGGQPDTICWLDYCLAERYAALRKLGNPIPPSARWLPLPATCFHEEKLTLFHDVNAVVQKEKTQYNDYVRTGIMLPFDIRKVPGINKKQKFDYQKEIARQIAKEILYASLPRQIEAFKNLYGIKDGNAFPFFVNYQTLLSPLMLEKKFGHTDNNARFVALMKRAFNSLHDDPDFSDFMRSMAEKTGAEIHLTYTNSAINRNAKLTVTDSFMSVRKERIQEAKAFLNRYTRNVINPRLAAELHLRRKAIDSLERLLDKSMDYNDDYKGLPLYARNIMMAALDHLVIGAQGLSINGCKSCRDRTGVFSAAVKVMKENPEAMRNWKVLEAGIINTLMQGHDFRSVGFHVAVVKAGLVHKNFKEGLEKSVQTAIKEFTPFSKSLGEVDEEELEEKMLADAEKRERKGMVQSGASFFARSVAKTERSPSSAPGSRRNSRQDDDGKKPPQKSESAPTTSFRRGSGSKNN